MKRKSFLASLAALPILPFVKVEAAPEKIVVPPIRGTGRVGCNDDYAITPEDVRRAIEEAVNKVYFDSQYTLKGSDLITPLK